MAIFTDHLNERKPPKLYGHGKPTRDYIYVADVVSALLAATRARRASTTSPPASKPT